VAGEKWHSIALSALFRQLSTRNEGLSLAEARERLEKNGKNALAEVAREPWYNLLLSQFNSLPVLLLIAAAFISLALGLSVDSDKLIDAVAITVAVLIAVLFGFFQEYKAEKAIEALRKMVVPRSIVVREGKDYSIDSSELVVGDIVLLDEGSRVPADMRLIGATNLACDQSMLTGESRPVKKSACTLIAKTPISDQENMVFSGTTIVRGHCEGVVVATGMDTEFGKIVGIVERTGEAQTPLQKDIDDLSKKLGMAGIGFALLFFAIGVAKGESAVNMLVVAVTLAVAVIPEGLPTVLAITLALGVQKMARKNAIVRKMAAVETLGSATVICTDKTGTLTRNQMAVREICLWGKSYELSRGALEEATVRRDKALFRAMEISLLCNNAIAVEQSGSKQMSGDPTETALLSAAMEACPSCERLRLQHKVVHEAPFDSDRKMMSVVRAYGSGRMAFVKGAPEKILPRCSRIFSDDGELSMAPERRRKLSSDAQAMGALGMRVLALAYKSVKKQPSYTASGLESSLTFVGLVGMEDPPRKEVPEAIALCRSAGIRVIMITGDSLSTARAIARRVGLLDSGQRVYDGPDLEAMDDAELRAALLRAGLFARVTPEQKFRITSALMDMGEVVAVTGDGVNDAPALKKANIGVAMGKSGTDVSKEVSDIVLTDDNFASIVNAVRYGRVIFNNIKAFVRYQLSTNIAALSLMFSAPVLSLPIPLYPIQILWINIMVDGPPALALGAEPSRHDEMEKPPRDPKAPFLSKNLLASILITGRAMAAISLAVYTYYLGVAPQKSGTAAFTLFVFLQLANALNCRSAHSSAFSRLLSNPSILLAIVICLLVHMAIIYGNALREVFRTVPLDGFDLALIAASASLIVIIEELKKRFAPSSTVY
jgi:Ca2+-transporting ATPase